jgi:C1A family cysteine protease
MLLSPLTAWSDPVELGYVKNAIKGKGAKWIAEETSISVLSQEEKKMRASLMVKPNEEEEAPLLSVVPETVAPPSLDWRSYNGISYVTPIRNQGNCGSCWAFATTGALEAVTNIKNNTPGYNLNLAEQILVSCSGAGSCSGGYSSSASNYIRDTGLPFETVYPYTATDGVCSTAAANWQASTYRINSWAYVTTSSPSVDTIKNALVSYGPLATRMAVYSDFDYYRSGIYSYTTGTYRGLHAVVIVGYDDTNQCFVVKNSWGTGWGEAGFFRIAYSELSSLVGFGQNTIVYYTSSPAPEPTPDPVTGISPVSVTYPASGGTGTVTVTQPTGAAWAATSNASWIAVTGGMTGSGNGTVQYKVTASSQTTTRTGTITIAGESFTVQQQKAVVKGAKRK